MGNATMASLIVALKVRGCTSVQTPIFNRSAKLYYLLSHHSRMPKTSSGCTSMTTTLKKQVG
jgi:hypothetical protein